MSESASKYILRVSESDFTLQRSSVQSSMAFSESVWNVILSLCTLCIISKDFLRVEHCRQWIVAISAYTLLSIADFESSNLLWHPNKVHMHWHRLLPPPRSLYQLVITILLWSRNVVHLIQKVDKQSLAFEAVLELIILLRGEQLVLAGNDKVQRKPKQYSRLHNLSRICSCELSPWAKTI